MSFLLIVLLELCDEVPEQSGITVLVKFTFIDPTDSLRPHFRALMGIIPQTKKEEGEGEKRNRTYQILLNK